MSIFLNLTERYQSALETFDPMRGEWFLRLLDPWPNERNDGKPRWARVVLILLFVLTSNPAFAAQDDGGLACATCGTTFLILIISIVVINIAILVWVYKDSKARCMDGGVIWMIVVMVFGIIGLIVYLFARPKGDLVICNNCNNKRISYSKRCPHCGSE